MTLRLVKVQVQAFFMDDDGTTLSEVVPDPITVAAKDWPAFSGETFPGLVEQLEAQVAAPAQPKSA